MPVSNFEEFKKDWDEVNINMLHSLLVISFWFFLFAALFTSPTLGFNTLSSTMQYVILFLILLFITFIPKRWGKNHTWTFLPSTLWRYYKSGKAKREELALSATILLLYLVMGFMLISTVIELNTGVITLSTFNAFSAYLSNVDSTLILFGSVLIFIFLTGFADICKELNKKGIKAKLNTIELVGMGIILALFSMNINYLLGTKYLSGTVVALAWFTYLSMFLLLSGLIVVFYIARKE